MPSSVASGTRMTRLQDWAVAPFVRRVGSGYARSSDASLAFASGERMETLVWVILAENACFALDARAELECAVRSFAAAFRDHGIVVEQMLIALKWATSMRRWRTQVENAEPLHDEIVLWSVREYFRYDG